MKNKIFILKIIGILLLFISFADVDYFFYQILRWYISLLSFYLAYIYNQKNIESWTWIFGISGILFNPIAPIYFGRELWAIIDFGMIGVLGVNTFLSRGK